MEPMRLNKFLSSAGVCSRREADRWIEEGRVLVDGKTAEPGQKVDENSEVTVDGRKVGQRREEVLLAVYKPQGIVCTTAEHRGEKNIVDLVHYPERIYPVGRLDKASEGLILMTNIGEITDQILRGSNYHEKEYLVKIDRPVTLDFLNQMRSGVPVLDTVTRPCQVKKVGPDSFRIILTQGLNRQIRRMCEALGCRVVFLKRLRVMNITLGSLKPGEYRKIEGDEKEQLFALLGGVRPKK
ncbi:pseudouridine synthase [Cuneatibacter sp. NSJ-177]|uniref:pseudouridine synthase n=1 Tax=Cuneatibacter sp. NSJ-177 TaxID=2931401 RepID=UPI001FD1921F|nr:pseudouridine synthase [Cuneatibacter sp. NSJ-177]MCJ7836117.1 pseudouridine synthase [Cuneatibacter sp. NSJ-177]